MTRKYPKVGDRVSHGNEEYSRVLRFKEGVVFDQQKMTVVIYRFRTRRDVYIRLHWPIKGFVTNTVIL